jgi:hypothetical protein
MRSVLVAAACAVALSPAAVAQQAPIKIGFISTFSGPSGQLGQELLDGNGTGPSSASIRSASCTIVVDLPVPPGGMGGAPAENTAEIQRRRCSRTIQLGSFCLLPKSDK